VVGKRGEGREGWETHLENGVLPLDAGRNGVLLDVDDEVAPLEVARHREGDVEVADRLGPLVGEGVLLGLLLGARRGLFGGGWLCCRCVLVEGCFVSGTFAGCASRGGRRKTRSR
jgi:hypothetical protein